MSHRRFLAVAALGCLLLCSACSKALFCGGGKDELAGIITGEITEYCEPGNGMQFVITDDTTLKQVFSAHRCTLPVIDFNTHSLLGQYADGGCEVHYLREVTRIDAEQRYHYKVTVRECGGCKKLSTSYNWVLVPKLPPGWQVTFETATD